MTKEETYNSGKHTFKEELSAATNIESKVIAYFRFADICSELDDKKDEAIELYKQAIKLRQEEHIVDDGLLCQLWKSLGDVYDSMWTKSLDKSDVLHVKQTIKTVEVAFKAKVCYDNCINLAKNGGGKESQLLYDAYYDQIFVCENLKDYDEVIKYTGEFEEFMKRTGLLDDKTEKVFLYSHYRNAYKGKEDAEMVQKYQNLIDEGKGC